MDGSIQLSIGLNIATFVLVAGIVFQGGRFIGEVKTLLSNHEERLKKLEADRDE